MKDSNPSHAPKSVTILGSTGSVGANTLDLIGRDPDAYTVVALTANENVAALAEQCRRFRPQLAVIANPERYGDLVAALDGTGIEVRAGADAVIEAASLPADWLMGAIVGAAGLKPTMAAVERGTTVALANKECLVCAGELVTAAVERCGSILLPVDSEHNAIFQVFDFDKADDVSRILLTASGGPFRTRARDSLAQVTPEEAVAHPNWSMGAKISVDSATMMNKGLELIEAYHLFPVPEERIEIVVHPQSIIHSMVEYADGSVLAQLGSPDMRTPIGYTLGWPERIATPSPRLDFATLARLDFEAPDPDRFPALTLTRDALRAGGSAPAVMNAANEVAVKHFLNRTLSFLGITDVVAETLAAMPARPLADLDDVIALDAEARRRAEEAVMRRA
ncbi:1-deoxy-D-xylulose-5-phosphate reductoisomerase [Rhodothalassium salexigens]|uniref:1-deoxy-D-xylulose-5-phosphate reductoisomerase n=1 Tax=Rhodothalassium salexigens TaxID=1086 RepID=UPI001912F208|nr:1-deoxy-D-xylulose-5-phosphate reductoisomerase [Rhodothalassium salexigens]MBK5911946.1 1-deoxy-D-xylulose-5-phosphate reductoisomerase [Rhodothalassium salexigens]MBK5922110.1 1-deoxy-D-xylulose-5-phosphate reductoisomerase [Rhodothalassium salexigens]